MVRGVNKVILLGNVVRLPEIRHSIHGRPWARFTVAVGYRAGNRNGGMRDGVDFLSVVVWGALAENCGKYLKKGSPVLVEGKIKVHAREDREKGEKRYVTNIEANSVTFLEHDSEASPGVELPHGYGNDGLNNGREEAEDVREEADIPF